MALRILVTCKRVEDPESRIQIRPDGGGTLAEGVAYKLNPFDEIAALPQFRDRVIARPGA